MPEPKHLHVMFLFMDKAISVKVHFLGNGAPFLQWFGNVRSYDGDMDV